MRFYTFIFTLSFISFLFSDVILFTLFIIIIVGGWLDGWMVRDGWSSLFAQVLDMPPPSSCIMVVRWFESDVLTVLTEMTLYYIGCTT